MKGCDTLSTYDKKSIGQRIKKIRLDKGMTQEEFGKFFGASKGNVATWEKGSSIPNADRLKMISKFGDITVNYLLYGDWLNNFDKLTKYYPESKRYLINNTPLFAIKNAMEEIYDNRISFDDVDKLKIIIEKLIKATEIFLNDTVQKSFEYLQSHKDDVRIVWDKLSTQGMKFDVSQNQLMNLLDNPSAEAIASSSNTIENLHNEILFSKNNGFLLLTIETYQISLNDILNNNYSTSKKTKSSEMTAFKYAQNNIYGHDYALAIYNELQDVVYVVSQYEEGYKNYEYLKNHFVIYNNEVYLSVLSAENLFTIDDTLTSVKHVDFFAPLLSILY